MTGPEPQDERPPVPQPAEGDRETVDEALANDDRPEREERDRGGR